ncbi:YkgJ family cysteine cluster protein [Leptothermofonsia sichuanensis E412]|uniref:YkgJ family cysteine cluster protein n=1 Tax=Leptothermofonsia sichuanensis TaxID=2917832 RepID=UPI001CA5F58E|nr:YkgJ family cysteine cluster protein [Leptothermofonsia sichuanensis]QZZ23121.1 YkgJ family cysteine cluster protein [Leptothermofonsia sichuanensis E412]
MATWQCVKNCGACCHLDPAERPELAEYLSPQELDLYLSMVGDGGWCVYFDHGTRECRIYPDRPRFCRVEAPVFQEMFGIEPEELNDFAIDCCRQQIEAVYGDRSLEMLRFGREVGFLPGME